MKSNGILSTFLKKKRHKLSTNAQTAITAHILSQEINLKPTMVVNNNETNWTYNVRGQKRPIFMKRNKTTGLWPNFPFIIPHITAPQSFPTAQLHFQHGIKYIVGFGMVYV